MLIRWADWAVLAGGVADRASLALRAVQIFAEQRTHPPIALQYCPPKAHSVVKIRTQEHQMWTFESKRSKQNLYPEANDFGDLRIKKHIL